MTGIRTWEPIEPRLPSENNGHVMQVKKMWVSNIVVVPDGWRQLVHIRVDASLAREREINADS